VHDLCAPPMDPSVGHVPRSSGKRRNRPDPQRFDASPSPLRCYHREIRRATESQLVSKLQRHVTAPLRKRRRDLDCLLDRLPPDLGHVKEVSACITKTDERCWYGCGLVLPSKLDWRKDWRRRGLKKSPFRPSGSNLRADTCQDSCLIGNSRAARVAISGNLSSATGVTERHQRPKL
jgi:hypothetical protein